MIATQQSHCIDRTTDGKVIVRDVEIFSAYDPRIDDDEELKPFDNQRVSKIVDTTRHYMERGSFPQIVIRHDTNGDAPQESVGRITSMRVVERDGVAYIVGDMEMTGERFDSLIASNAYPRRSAEIWADKDHLSEVALLGRETPRRAIHDTHFRRLARESGERVTCALEFAYVGGGLSTYIPKEITMPHKTRNEEDAKKEDELPVEEAAPADAEVATEEEEEEEERTEEDGGEKVEMMDGDMVIENRRLRAEVRMLSQRQRDMERALKEETFAREIESMSAGGWRIPNSRKGAMLAQLMESSDPESVIETWRECFARDPINKRIDTERAAFPRPVNARTLASLVAKYAGDPEGYRKAVAGIRIES